MWERRTPSLLIYPAVTIPSALQQHTRVQAVQAYVTGYVEPCPGRVLLASDTGT